MDAGPKRVSGADLEHCDVKWAKSLADISEAVPFSGVRSIEDAARGANESERCPKRLESIEQAAAREVACR